jgi:hypothetical protein
MELKFDYEERERVWNSPDEVKNERIKYCNPKYVDTDGFARSKLYCEGRK